jgi:hypothetical protein
MSDYIQLANIIGHANLNKDLMHKDDFYTLCMKNPNDNIGIRKKSKNPQDHMPTFFSSDIDISYLCSDFVRFCLSLYKSKQDIHRGEMTIVPKQEIPISKELREYIEDFLPDFYNIRDIVK